MAKEIYGLRKYSEIKLVYNNRMCGNVVCYSE